MTPVYIEHTPILEMHDTRSITYITTNMVEAILIELGRPKNGEKQWNDRKNELVTWISVFP